MMDGYVDREIWKKNIGEKGKYARAYCIVYNMWYSKSGCT